MGLARCRFTCYTALGDLGSATGPSGFRSPSAERLATWRALEARDGPRRHRAQALRGSRRFFVGQLDPRPGGRIAVLISGGGRQHRVSVPGVGASGFPVGGWPHLPIPTRRLLLRLPASGDVDAIRAACAHPSTRRGAYLLPHPYLRRHAAEFVRRKRAEFRRRESLALAIVARSDVSLVGMIELTPRSRADRVAELGYWIAPGQRGQGFATEAARAMCEVGFELLRLHRIEAGALARNHASIRVLDKAGFRHEGRHRARARVGRRWWDLVSLGRLADKQRRL